MAKPRPAILLRLASVLLATSYSSATFADETDDARAQAEALFNAGRAAVAKNDYATACPKFEESLKLARRAGTLFNLAQCEEHEGRLVTAVQYYKEGIVVLEPDDPRLAPSKKQLQLIEPRVPHLTVTLASPLPPGGRVTLDGREVASLNVEFAVNPGKHELTVLAPKFADAAQTFEIAESERVSISVEVGPRLPDPPTKTITVNALSPQRIGAIAAFGVGGLGVIGAAITGGLLVSAKSRVDEGCPNAQCTTAAGYEASQQGKPLLVVNTIAWGLGLAGAGAGTFLLLYKNKKEQKTTPNTHSFVFGPGFVGVEGSF